MTLLRINTALAVAFLAVLAASRAVAAGAAETTPWPNAGWQSATPESQGVSSRFDANALGARSLRVHGQRRE